MVSDTTVYAYPPSTQEAEVCSMASLGHIARAPSKKKKKHGVYQGFATKPSHTEQ
jgi:hypothetical protein